MRPLIGASSRGGGTLLSLGNLLSQSSFGRRLAMCHSFEGWHACLANKAVRVIFIWSCMYQSILSQRRLSFCLYYTVIRTDTHDRWK